MKITTAWVLTDSGPELVAATSDEQNDLSFDEKVEWESLGDYGEPCMLRIDIDDELIDELF